ncbi:class I mannose-6-phosphate isomerase [Myxococcota bacterium]|nr:class I mannose-6-phosphate isomerase [Myxococcota bacterium]MBU1898068.1 class I mannose-6-phosphate isomerase [Myxococcota bacterium]
MKLHPLVFEPIYKDKVWGGDAVRVTLGRGGASLRCGESWELVDLDITAPSGGGGEAAHSVVARGPLRGRALRDLLDEDQAAILGDHPRTVAGGFPLLIKYLDARQDLSVQVHPDAEFVAHHPGAALKSEAWYILDAAEDACIYLGLRPGVDAAALRRGIESGALVDFLTRVQVKPGEIYFLPSGAPHALGAGCLVAEIQTPSDTTFRLYDWGRHPPRPLHIEEALACATFGPIDHGIFDQYEAQAGFERQGRVSCPHFEISTIKINDFIPLRPGPTALMILEGGLDVRWRDQSMCFGPYDTILCPAGLGATTIHSPNAHVLEVRFPFKGEK